MAKPMCTKIILSVSILILVFLSLRGITEMMTIKQNLQQTFPNIYKGVDILQSSPYGTTPHVDSAYQQNTQNLLDSEEKKREAMFEQSGEVPQPISGRSEQIPVENFCTSCALGKNKQKNSWF